MARATSSLPVPDSPCDQHRRHAARHLLDQRAHLLHRRRVAGHAAERLARRQRRRRRRRDRPRRRAPAASPPDAAPTAGSTGRPSARRAPRPSAEATTRAELLQVDRLGEVVVGAGLERLDRVLGRAVGGDDDRLLAPAALLEPAQQVEAGAVGQAHVGDDGAVGAVLQMEQRFLRPCRRSRRRSPRAAASARTACAGRARRRRRAG